MKPQPQIDPNISSERIQTQAAKIVASREFSESARLRRFLQFTVEQTLRGQGDQIKEYLIGVEVFGRGESFDQRIDPVVRIQAGKLRAVARVIKAGRTIGLVECDVKDEKQQLIARASSTLMTLRGDQAQGR